MERLIIIHDIVLYVNSSVSNNAVKLSAEFLYIFILGTKSFFWAFFKRCITINISVEGASRAAAQAKVLTFLLLY